MQNCRAPFPRSGPNSLSLSVQERSTLQLAVVLVDINVPAQPSDQQLIRFLEHTGRDFLVVATKSDKLSGNKLRSALSSPRSQSWSQ